MMTDGLKAGGLWEGRDKQGFEAHWDKLSPGSNPIMLYSGKFPVSSAVSIDNSQNKTLWVSQRRQGGEPAPRTSVHSTQNKILAV